MIIYCKYFVNKKMYSKITHKVNLEKIYELIDVIDILSNIHKEFYKEILNLGIRKY